MQHVRATAPNQQAVSEGTRIEENTRWPERISDRFELAQDRTNGPVERSSSTHVSGFDAGSALDGDRQHAATGAHGATIEGDGKPGVTIGGNHGAFSAPRRDVGLTHVMQGAQFRRAGPGRLGQGTPELRAGGSFMAGSRKAGRADRLVG